MKNAKIPEKIEYKSELEFINAVADDCISQLSEKNRNYLVDNPRAIDYHFSYCMYIRNHYIHVKDFSKVSFSVEPDHLSYEIICMIFSKLLPEYEYGNSFVDELYGNKGFIKLRREYKKIYGEYPVNLVEKYKEQIMLEPVFSKSEWHDISKEIDYDKELAIIKQKLKKRGEYINCLLRELAEYVWQEELLVKTAEEAGVSFNDISHRIEELKRFFFEEQEYIPLQVCLLPYKKKIGQERYIVYRRILGKELQENPRLMEKLDNSYFDDRTLARSVLKYGWTLKYLPQYKDDEKMVRYCLGKNGEAIEYASKRFQKNREWAKFAIEHSAKGTIMYLDCMKPYRKDKELVYLACKIKRWNLVYVDKSFRDDYDLAKICMEQIGNHNEIYSYLSKRLRDNKELAFLDLQERFPSIEYYSARLRNDDEIAAKLYELHGIDSWGWYHMSKRIQKKYGLES